VWAVGPEYQKKYLIQIQPNGALKEAQCPESTAPRFLKKKRSSQGTLIGQIYYTGILDKKCQLLAIIGKKTIMGITKQWNLERMRCWAWLCVFFD
jgi:hypothetical protein